MVKTLCGMEDRLSLQVPSISIHSAEGFSRVGGRHAKTYDRAKKATCGSDQRRTGRSHGRYAVAGYDATRYSRDKGERR